MFKILELSTNFSLWTPELYGKTQFTCKMAPTFREFSIFGHWLVWLQTSSHILLILFLLYNLKACSVIPRLLNKVYKQKERGTNTPLFTKIAQGSCLPTSRGVTILNTSHLKQLLRHWSRHNTSSSGCRNQTYTYRATFACHLKSQQSKLQDKPFRLSDTTRKEDVLCEQLLSLWCQFQQSSMTALMRFKK